MSKPFRDSLTSPNRGHPADWCAANVNLVYGSSRAPKFSPDITPWIRDPIREIFDNSNREIVIKAPVGSGKSTAIEAMLAYIIAEDPGPTLITGQTDQDISDWAESRMWRVLRGSPATAGLFPSERGKVRKMEVMFPHMEVWLTGANMSGLQSKSIRWLIGDEVWMWKRGMLEEFRGRMHRRWNGRRVLMGQAGIEGDDFDVAWEQCEQREWCWTCPSCGTVQSWQFQRITFPEDGSNAERAAQCVMTCSGCDATLSDDIAIRRSLCEGSVYEVTKKAEIPGHIGFHYDALTLWDSPWSEQVLQFLNAKDALAKGDTTPLRQVIQKQRAESWKEDLGITRPPISIFEATVQDYLDGKKIDGETYRFATIDVQRDHFWLLIRAWRSDGSSVALWYGRVNAEETIAEIVSRYQIEPRCVYIDTGYDSGRVYDIIVRYGWWGIRGDKPERYKHAVHGGTIERLYSPRKFANAPGGGRARYFFVAADGVKNLLSNLRSGNGAPWQVLEDLHKSHAEQLDSEVREEFLNPRDGQTTMRWVKKNRHNHAWDCEVYQVAAALTRRVFE